jgi:multidrug efflux pump subunit AcrA (membrane-fusion protein)
METKSKIRRLIKSKKTWAAVLALVVIVVVIVVNRSGGEVYSPVTVERRDLSTYYSFTGNIEANHTQKVLATGSNPVKKFYVEEGNKVAVGDLLVEFDNASLQANIAQARANAEISQINYEKTVGSGRTERTLQAESSLSTANWNYKTAATALERTQQFYDNGVAALTDLENAQKTYDSAAIALKIAQNEFDTLEATLSQEERTAAANLAQARASLANLEQQYEESKIYATDPGTVSKLHVKVGEQMINGTAILEVVDFDRLEVTIKVDEYGLATMTEGKEVVALVNASGLAAAGVISEISESATVEGGVSYFKGTVSLVPNEQLRVGMSVELKVPKQSADQVLAVPMAAINLDENYQAYVLMEDASGQQQRVSVRTGVNDGMFIEILEGLNEGDVVLVSAASGVGDMMPDFGGGPGGVRMEGGGSVRVQSVGPGH